MTPVWQLMKRRFALGYVLVTAGVGASLLYLDATGVFIYFGYVSPILVVTCVILGGVYIAGKVGRLSRGDVVAFGMATLSLIGAALFCLFLPTSQRKAFYLDAQSLRPGMSLEEVQHRMAAYPSFEKYAGSVTFLCRASASTVDTTVVRLTSDGARVAAVEYSPD